MTGRQIMTADEIRRATVRISHEIVEKQAGTDRSGSGRHPASRRPARPPDRRGDRRARRRDDPRRRARHHVLPRRPVARRPAAARQGHRPAVRPRTGRRSCSSTTSSTPAGRSGRRWTRSWTSGGRRRSAWRSSSTAATASCRSGPTTSARTCRPRARRSSGSTWPRPTARTASTSSGVVEAGRRAGRGMSLRGAGRRRASTSRRSSRSTEPPSAAGPLGPSPPARPRRVSLARDRARHAHDRRDARGPRPADRQGPGPARHRRDDPLLRSLDPDAGVVRGRRQEPVRGRREHRGRELVGVEGRVARRHDPDGRGARRRHDRHAPRDVGCAVSRRRALRRLDPQRRRRLARPSVPGAARPVHDPRAPAGRPGLRGPEGRDPRRRAPFARRPLQPLDADRRRRRPVAVRPVDAPARLRALGGGHRRGPRSRPVHGHGRRGCGAARRRRRDGPADPARADERRAPALAARVRGALRADPRPPRARPPGRPRDASGPDERGRRDRARGRRRSRAR